MANFDALELLLSAKYIGAPAFRAMAADVEGLVASTSGLSRAGAAFSALGTVTLGAGIAMAAGMAKAVTVAAQYDDAIQRIIAVGGLHASSVLTAKDAHDALTSSLIANRTELQALNAEIAYSATTWGQNPTDLAKGAYYLYSALPALKISSAQALGYNIINDLAAYSRASGPTDQGGVSFGQAAQDLPRLFSGYNTPISQWGGGMGIMTFLENNAHMTQAQLVQSMSKFLPAATALGMNFPDAATLMAALASSGVYGSRAGTEASSGLVSLFGGSKMNLTGLQALGIDTSKFFDKKTGSVLPPDQVFATLAGALTKLTPQQRLAAIHDTFGLIGMRAFGGLLNTGMGKYDNLLSTEKSLGIYNNPAATQKYMFAVAGSMMNSPGAKFQSLIAAFQVLGIVVGNKLMPFVMKAEDALTKLALAMANVVANSHSLGDFIKNTLGAIFGHTGGIGKSSFASIAAGMMGFSGGHMTFPAGGLALLGTLGGLFGAGGGFKLLGGGLKMLGGIDAGFAKSHATGTANYAKKMEEYLRANAKYYKDLQSYEDRKKALGDELESHLNLLQGEAKSEGLRTYLSKSGQVKLWGIGKGANPKTRAERLMKMANYTEAHQNAMDEYMSKLGGLQMPGMPTKPEEFKGPASLGQAMMRPFKDLAKAAHDGTANMLRAISGVLKDIPGTFRKAFHGLSGIVKGGLGALVGGFKTLVGLGGRVAGFGKMVAGSFGVIALHLRNFNLGAAVSEFGTLAKVIGGPIISHVKNLGGLLKTLATGGFGMLKTAIMSGIPALVGFAAPIAAIIAVVLLVAAVITIAVIAFTHFRTQTMAAIQPLITTGVAIFMTFKNTVQSTMAMIGAAWAKAWVQISPAMRQLLAAIQQMTPVWQVLGAVIGAVVAVILAVLTGLVNGFISALPPIINLFTGIIQLITHVAQIIIDIFTGQWGKIPALVGSIFMDILHILGSAASAILSFIGGFIGGFIGFFQNLFDVLVGHSIIPDMVRAIVMWIAGLPGKTLGLIAGWVVNLITNVAKLEVQFVQYVQQLQQQVAALFLQMAQKAIEWGANILLGFIQGVQSKAGQALGAVQSFFGNVVAGVRNFLGIRSPSTMFMGIGQDSAQGYINGIQSKQGQAVAASTNVANAAAKAFASPTNLASAYGAGEDIGQALADGTYAAAIQANIGANISAAVQGQLHGAKGGTPHFAAGGTVPYTGLMTVGEHGKEMVMLPRGARVFNHSDTMAMLRPGEFGPHRVNPDLGFIQHGQQTALFGPHQMQVPHDFYDRIREAVASGHQQAQGSTNQAAMRTTMQQARQVQSLREELIARYDRRSGFEDQYRYAVQYTQ